MDEYDLSLELSARKEQHLYRRRLVVESPQTKYITVSGQRYLNFCSNNYLGLANHPDVIRAVKNAIDKYGVGSGASHLVVGHSAVHHQLEEVLADWVGKPRAVLFSSGYMANLGMLDSLLSKEDVVLEDKLNHASLIDGGLMSAAKFARYRHSDISHLKVQLGKNAQARRKLIVTDGVFSMDGDVAPLTELAEIAVQHKAKLIIDDAHGLGVLGQQGAGSVSAAGINNDAVWCLMGTLGKALGVAGAFVAGDEDVAETLIQTARSYIYTTAMPPSMAAAVLVSINLARNESWRQEKLQHLQELFSRGAKELGYQVLDSHTAIQPILVGDEERAVALSAALKNEHIMISAIRYPTVAKGSARLRVTLTAEHEVEDIQQLLTALEKVKPLYDA